MPRITANTVLCVPPAEFVPGVLFGSPDSVDYPQAAPANRLPLSPGRRHTILAGLEYLRALTAETFFPTIPPDEPYPNPNATPKFWPAQKWGKKGRLPRVPRCVVLLPAFISTPESVLLDPVIAAAADVGADLYLPRRTYTDGLLGWVPRVGTLTNASGVALAQAGVYDHTLYRGGDVFVATLPYSSYPRPYSRAYFAPGGHNPGFDYYDSGTAEVEVNRSRIAHDRAAFVLAVQRVNRFGGLYLYAPDSGYTLSPSLAADAEVAYPSEAARSDVFDGLPWARRTVAVEGTYPTGMFSGAAAGTAIAAAVRAFWP